MLGCGERGAVAFWPGSSQPLQRRRGSSVSEEASY